MLGGYTGLGQDLGKLGRRKLVALGKARKGGIDIVGADGHLHARDFLALQFLVHQLLPGELVEVALRTLQLQEGDAAGNVAIGDRGVVDDDRNRRGSLHRGSHGNGEGRQG
jgi:hypothetical protein